MKAHAVLVERSRLVGAAALLGTASVVASAIGMAVAPGAAPDLALATVAFGWPFVIALIAAWAACWRAARTEVLVEVVDGALRIDRQQRAAPQVLTRGEAVVLTNACIRVELRGAYRQQVRLEVRKAASARALLAALGLDRRIGTSQFRVRRERGYAGLLTLGGFMAFPASMVLVAVDGWLGLTFALAVVSGLVLDWLRMKVVLTIGHDGLDLRSPFGRRFIAHREIRSVLRSDVGFEVQLASGELQRIDTRSERAGAAGSTTDPSYDAAQAAWAAWTNDAQGARPAAAMLLARGDRSASEWIASLRGLAAAGGSGYRVAAVDEQALFAVLVDPGAARELRVAAALVLGAKEEHAPRLRVVADDVADPLVRRIAVASLDDEEANALAAELEEAATQEGFAPRSIRPPGG